MPHLVDGPRRSSVDVARRSERRNWSFRLPCAQYLRRTERRDQPASDVRIVARPTFPNYGHPPACGAQALATSASLATLRSNLARQNATRLLGVVAFGHPGCRCQKHPCTNTHSRGPGWLGTSSAVRSANGSRASAEMLGRKRSLDGRRLARVDAKNTP